jgi:hypothetical protein
MNANAVAKHYDKLTPEERSRLLAAAGGRGDEAERDRLVNAGQRIPLSIQDHAPYVYALYEMDLLTFIELLDEAAKYRAACTRWIELTEDEPRAAEAAEEDEGAPDEPGTDDTGRADGERTLEERLLGLYLAQGCILKTKADGWKLFCERWGIPPFALWECLPGFEDLRQTLAQAEKAAFVPEGFLRWLNAVRPAGQQELTEVPLTAERLADATEKVFRERVAWWGG